MTIRYSRRSVLLAAGAATVLAGCGSTDTPAGPASGDAGPVTLTVYTDQHAELVSALTDAYAKQSDVTFQIQNDATVGQLQAEGAASRADVFLSEEPTTVAQLGATGLVTPIEDATLKAIRPGLSSPKGNWAAYAARARVLFYNPTLIKEDALPTTLADIVDPQFKGQFCWAPSGAFVATTQYLISSQGMDQTRAFCTAVNANGANEQKNGNVRDTVEAGKHAMGLSNHYYWWILAGQKGGADKMTSKLFHFPKADAGNLVLSSGAAILKNSKNAEAAQKFVAWLTAADGGQKIIAADSSAQYPVAPGVASAIAGDLDEISSPSFDMDVLADSAQAEDLLKQLGMSKG